MNRVTQSKKSKTNSKLLIGLTIPILLIVIFFVWYKIHMSYENDSYMSFNIDDMNREGKNVNAHSTVYKINDINSDNMIKIYEALGVKVTGNVAIKLSTGEAGNPNYLDPNLIKDLVQSVDGTIVECNTAYSGSKRAETAMHRQVAKEHGFTEIADVDIMDEDGYMIIPVDGGTHLKENWVGKNLANYDFVIVLSHFKGHPMGGFGGALKNISIGIGSREGKARIHSAGFNSHAALFNPISLITNQNDFLESMAEAAKSVSDYEDHGKKMIYISVMNKMSVDCDCVSEPEAVDMNDIGILASTDPVALDQSCVDLVYKAPDGTSLQHRIEEKNGIHILKHAEEIGLGNRAYELIELE